MFILILLTTISGVYPAQAITSIEFSSKETCIAAGQAAQETFDRRSHVDFVCAPKYTGAH